MPRTALDVLILYVDQWRWDALGCLGSPARTPVLDRLAAGGVHFDHAFVQSPVCMPSRVSTLTGQYPSALGITHMGVPVPETTETIATILARRGWRTANIGKLHFQPHANRDHTLRHPAYGFTDLVLSEEPGPYEDDYRAWVRATDPEAEAMISSGLPPAAHTWHQVLGTAPADPGDTSRSDYATVRVFEAAAELTHTAWVATRTIDHLRGLGEHERSLTIASFFAPHPPFHVPQRFLDRYDPSSLPLPALTADERSRQAATGVTDDQLRVIRHGYLAAISEVDHHVGRILDAVDARGRRDDTVVVFVSDHGEWLGDHLRLAKGFPADDPVSRVPLIVSWPSGVSRPGRTCSTLVEAVDIVPTVLDALGVPVPSTVQGRSLHRVLVTGDDARDPEVAITEHRGWRSVRTRDHRYVITADGTEHLWFVGEDPTNEVEVVEGRESLVAAHRKTLLQRMLTVERPLPRTWPY
ncbi:MAG: sulfatase family protein [Dermatophilaceae bacterium]